MQAPDFTQSFNRYSYCFNNPLVYVDPDGEIAWFVPIIIGAAIFGTGNLVAHAVRGDVNSFGDGLKCFGQGALAGAVLGAAWQFAPLIPGIGPAIQTGMTIYGKVQLGTAGFGVLGGVFQSGDDWSPFNNSLKIFLGNFYLDENCFWGGVWQGISRHTWEIPNTFVGHTFTQGRNSFGYVDRVEYNAGATFAISENVADMNGWRGVSLGNFNIIKLGGAFTDVNRDIFWHEYGHTRDSRLFGPFYLLIIGIPSASGAQWTEDRANEYSRRYRRRHRIPF